MKKAALIMAGGKGERFWPLGRESLPKQFLKVGTKKTLLEEAVDRFKPLCGEENVYIITGRKYEKQLGDFLPKFNPENVIYEAQGRDTAAAVAYGTAYIQSKLGEDAVIIVAAADHAVNDVQAFTATLSTAAEIAESSSSLVTIGIPPTRPETGYGYIHAVEGKKTASGADYRKVEAFKEKPDIETAKEFIKDGDYYWNSGMFIWKASVVMDALKQYASDIYENTQKLAAELEKGAATEKLDEIFLEYRKVSVDFAVMENAEDISCVPAAFDWDDVGSFNALERIIGKDGRGNTINAKAVTVDSEGCIINSTDDSSVIAVAGMKDVVVIKTDDAVLVYPKGEDKLIKKVLAELRESEELKGFS